MRKFNWSMIFLFLFAGSAFASFDSSYIHGRLDAAIEELNGPRCGGIQANMCITDPATQSVLEYLTSSPNISGYSYKLRLLISTYKSRRGWGQAYHALIIQLERVLDSMDAYRYQQAPQQQYYPQYPQPTAPSYHGYGHGSAYTHAPSMEFPTTTLLPRVNTIQWAHPIVLTSVFFCLFYFTFGFGKGF